MWYLIVSIPDLCTFTYFSFHCSLLKINFVFQKAILSEELTGLTVPVILTTLYSELLAFADLFFVGFSSVAKTPYFSLFSCPFLYSTGIMLQSSVKYNGKKSLISILKATQLC